MKKKKQIIQKKTKHYNKANKLCNHCMGALKVSLDDVSCFMCGRDANHFCENCMVARNLTMKTA